MFSENLCEQPDLIQQDEIQPAYKEIPEFIGKLRVDFAKKYPHCDIGNIYQGYLDMSYFSLTPAEAPLIPTTHENGHRGVCRLPCRSGKSRHAVHFD